MKTFELYEALALGELSNLAMAEEVPGKINEKNQPRIIRYANEALLELYSRFLLKEKSVLVQMLRHITFYHLLPRFAMYESSSNEPYKYIMDLPDERFIGDVIKVIAVYDHTGHVLPLNDEARHWSVFTPQASMIQVPHPLEGYALSVTYQARHPILVHGQNQDIDIPAVLESALTAYIAYKVFSHMSTPESTAKGQEHYAVFESKCAMAEEKDLVSTSITTSNTRFYNNGWI